LPFDADEARDGVTRARDALPPTAFVDPELVRDAARTVDDALARLVRRGTLIREGNRYALAPNRHDPRFPDVADMIAYQTTFHAETLAALQSLSP
jgi:hypothetical protein